MEAERSEEPLREGANLQQIQVVEAGVHRVVVIGGLPPVGSQEEPSWDGLQEEFLPQQTPRGRGRGRRSRGR